MNPAALNPYAYVYNNPTNYVDETGEFPWAVVGACAAGAAAGVTTDALLARGKMSVKGTVKSAAIGCVSGAAGFGGGKAVVKVASKYGVKSGVHPAHHYFPKLGKKPAHLQVNIRKKGAKASGKVFRIPKDPRPWKW